jgi:ribosomal-protein-alanine N-acetyltransferase
MSVVLETERLALRHFVWEDSDALAEIMADPEVMRYIGTGQPKTREETRRLLGLWIDDGVRAWPDETLERLPQLNRAVERDASFGLWATVEKATGRLIGRCGLLAWDLDGAKETEVGYLLARDSWGKGLATEAAEAVRDYGMDRLGFDRLVSLIRPDNVRSQRVAVKNGMTHERDATVRGVVARVYSVGRERRDALRVRQDPRPPSSERRVQ